MARVNGNFSFLYCERQVSRLNALTLRLPSRSPSGNKPSLANHGDEFAQDLHPLPFSPDAYGLTPYAFIQLCLMPNYSSIPIVSCQCRGKNEICVCVHLTQTRYAQKSVRRNERKDGIWFSERCYWWKMRKISGYRILGNRLFTGFLEERQTGLEPATSTLARWRTTNCTTIAFSLSLMYISDEIYNNTASYVWQAFS